MTDEFRTPDSADASFRSGEAERHEGAICHIDVDPIDDRARAAVTAYVTELDDRFPGGFDPGDALDDEAPRFRDPHGVFVLAVAADDEVVGCAGLHDLEPGVGEIKRMWVAPRARGRWVGRSLLRAMERRSADRGHHVIRLDTNSVLTTAIALYESSGYGSIERYNDNPYARRWFEKVL